MATISLTSTLLIISLALIAIIEGSGSGDASSSSSSPCKMGKLVNPSLLKHEHTTTNDEKKVNVLKVASKKANDPIFKNTKIILEIGGIKCEASVKNNKGEECKIPVKEIKKGPQSGTLIFSYAEGKEVKVPFKDVHMFDDNMCNIVLEGYNMKTHELDFTLNGLYPLKVVPEDKRC